MPGAARVGDTTAHGGTVVGPGVATVLIAGMPAAVVGDMHACVIPPPLARPGQPVRRRLGDRPRAGPTGAAGRRRLRLRRVRRRGQPDGGDRMTTDDYPQVGRGWAFPPRWERTGVGGTGGTGPVDLVTNDGAEHVGEALVLLLRTDDRQPRHATRPRRGRRPLRLRAAHVGGLPPARRRRPPGARARRASGHRRRRRGGAGRRGGRPGRRHHRVPHRPAPAADESRRALLPGGCVMTAGGRTPEQVVAAMAAAARLTPYDADDTWADVLFATAPDGATVPSPAGDARPGAARRRRRGVRRPRRAPRDPAGADPPGLARGHPRASAGCPRCPTASSRTRRSTPRRRPRCCPAGTPLRGGKDAFGNERRYVTLDALTAHGAALTGVRSFAPGDPELAARGRGGGPGLPAATRRPGRRPHTPCGSTRRRSSSTGGDLTRRAGLHGRGRRGRPVRGGVALVARRRHDEPDDGRHGLRARPSRSTLTGGCGAPDGETPWIEGVVAAGTAVPVALLVHRRHGPRDGPDGIRPRGRLLQRRRGRRHQGVPAVRGRREARRRVLRALGRGVRQGARHRRGRGAR